MIKKQKYHSLTGTDNETICDLLIVFQHLDTMDCIRCFDLIAI